MTVKNEAKDVFQDITRELLTVESSRVLQSHTRRVLIPGKLCCYITGAEPSNPGVCRLSSPQSQVVNVLFHHRHSALP